MTNAPTGSNSLDPATLVTLPELLSAPRLRPYVDACSGSAAQAIRLHTWNLEVASAFWGEIQALEVTMRNAMNNQLRTRFNRADWWMDPKATLNYTMSKQLNDAKRKAEDTARRRQRPPTADGVVAVLSFGFWTGLTGSGKDAQYETRYWQPSLHHAFPHYSGNRGTLNRSLESIRLFRNRIAHHEPIFARHLNADHQSHIRIAG